MKPISHQSLLDALRWRYATKVFDPARQIPADLWKAVEESLVLTPSSFGLQPYRFIVVTDPALKGRLKGASWGQSQVADCSHLVVFTAKREMAAADVDRYVQRVAAVRGTTAEALAGFRDMMMKTLVEGGKADRAPEWAANQVYIALGQFMAAAALLGLDACPMEGIDAAQYDAILGLDGTPYRTVVACPVGFRAAGDKYATLPKVRFPAQELVETR